MPGIYIHIPFCHGKCIYCDFYSVPGRARMAEVARGIVEEFQARREEIPGNITTLYIGGGTPSVLPPQMLAEIVGEIPMADVEEFTVEVNPENVTDDYVEALAAMGVNRISMGVQSLHDPTLRSIGRRHDAARALQALDTIRRAGITEISADLIYGLPGQSAGDWAGDLRRILGAGITHLSAYCLTYHEATPLYRMAAAGRIVPDSDDVLAEKFAELRRATARAGFRHYEISNFALPGHESRHNSAYWSPDGRWLGLGPAAHSFDGHTRRYNPADINTWLENLPDPSIIEEESDLDRINDHIVTALRTADGLDLDTLPGDIAQSLVKDSRRFVDDGSMVLRDGHLAIRPDLWLISDSFIREMLREDSTRE